MTTKTILAAFFLSIASADLQLRSTVTLCDTQYRVTGILDGGDRPVYKAMTSRASDVAIKTLPVDHPTDLIQKTRQASFLRVFCVQTLESNLYVVMEAGESLVDAIRPPNRLDENQMSTYIASLALNLQLLRQYGVIFEHLATKNLILCNGGLKISKFGSLVPLAETDDQTELKAYTVILQRILKRGVPSTELTELLRDIETAPSFSVNNLLTRLGEFN